MLMTLVMAYTSFFGVTCIFDDVFKCEINTKQNHMISTATTVLFLIMCLVAS